MYNYYNNNFTEEMSFTLLSRDYKEPNYIFTKANKILSLGNINPSGKGMNGNVFSEEGLSPTITTNKGEGLKILSDYRIRRLTPKECWRLMGFKDEDFDKAKNSGMSNTQLYKQAGNSIVVNVLESIFKNLFKEYID